MKLISDTAITIVIPYSRRPEILTVLKSDYMRRPEVQQILIVECGKSDLDIKASLGELPCRESIGWINAHRSTFNRPYAINIGIANAVGQTILIHDADTILDHEYIDTAIRETTPGVAHTVRYIEESLDGVRRDSGILMCSRPDLLKVSGLNSNLTGWGWDDHDLRHRLGTSRVTVVSVGTGVHLSHTDTSRDINLHEPKWTSEYRNRIKSSRNIDLGNIQGTLEDDYHKWLYGKPSEDNTRRASDTRKSQPYDGQ
jgi:glycosyltransferase involved in cell wall biosynthesis